MEVRFTARHFKASTELQNYVREQIENLAKFYERITSCRIILDAEKKEIRTVEITVNIRKRLLSAKASADNMHKAIDGALDRIERQLKKHNEKIKDHRKINHNRETEIVEQGTEAEY